MSAPHSGAITPDSYAAQRISPSAGASPCPWFPKCSALNATRRGATRRDTRITSWCARHDGHPITAGGKGRAVASSRPSTGSHDVFRHYQCTRRYAQRGAACSRGDHLRSSIPAHADPSLPPTTDASAAPHAGDKCGPTCANYRYGHLHHYRYQYLTRNLDHYMASYRRQPGAEHVSSGRAVHSKAHLAAHTAIGVWHSQQTWPGRRGAEHGCRACNQIVTDASRRVVFGPGVDARPTIGSGIRRQVVSTACLPARSGAATEAVDGAESIADTGIEYGAVPNTAISIDRVAGAHGYIDVWRQTRLPITTATACAMVGDVWQQTRLPITTAAGCAMVAAV
jgi:hypothetical protein